MNRLSRSHRGTARQRLQGRAVFAGSLLLFLIIGIAVVGAFSAQWWLLALPFALLIGPALSLRREAGRGAGDDRYGTSGGGTTW